ncbi:MAG: hypothetical protein JNK74_21455 [Candidatus Hydrogenedentes bacterium]|nr:hypothetical protein [Candidatus Hydrogenedentota bacterium]
MNPGTAVLLANAASTFALTGLIWTIQIAHYPAFRYIAGPKFIEFEAFHQRQISRVVVPLMLVELFTAAALLGWRPATLPVHFAITGGLLVAAIWACTFAVQVPLHNRLTQGYDRAAIDALVNSNWIRTALWSLRAGLLLWALCVTWPVAEQTL